MPFRLVLRRESSAFVTDTITDKGPQTRGIPVFSSILLGARYFTTSTNASNASHSYIITYYLSLSNHILTGLRGAHDTAYSRD
jgi:hypothetical protein